MIRTIIVEDNLYMQNHLAHMLETDGRFLVAAVLRDAFEAEQRCAVEPIDYRGWMAMISA